jgi:hypothetical protein
MTNYVWLVGWSGDLDHYSWIAFTPSPAGADHGTWATLAGQCGTCTSLFFCEGSDGSYTVEPAGMPGISRIDLSYPTACGATKKAETWIIGSFVRISGWLPNPEWTLPLEVTGGGPSLSATGYPRSRCNAAFTSCDPIF